MRFGWRTHRAAFREFFDELDEIDTNHLQNLILLMDFMIPVVIHSTPYLFCTTYFSSTFDVGARLLPCYPLWNFRRRNATTATTVCLVCSVVQACLSSRDRLSLAHHGVSYWYVAVFIHSLRYRASFCRDAAQKLRQLQW